MKQQQFLNVIPKDEAMQKFMQHLHLQPLGVESVLLADALGRILACDVRSTVDVSGFDRSNVDGFAIRAADAFGATEESPHLISLHSDTLTPGIEPKCTILPGIGIAIATGAMLPRGADAVVMIEQTDIIETADGPQLEIRRAVTPGENITFTGTDIACGETILRTNQALTSRELGVVAAVGLAEVPVYRRPEVAIISTGNEIVPPGNTCPPGFVYDSNAAILTAAVTEAGGVPVCLGIVGDDKARLKECLQEAMQYDLVLLSGGTSKGEGDITYQAVAEALDAPGIIAHGVSLKPGKPICLAVSGSKPVVILPGFPTSAVFTFHEFVVPIIRAFAGRQAIERETVNARIPLRLNSARGRTEYLLVSLFDGPEGLVAYPMGKGSGSVTTFSLADGFITIDQQEEILDAGTEITVQLLGNNIKPADLVVIGSHCVGLDFLLSEMQKLGFSTKALFIGSMGGLNAVKRGECDVAGIHLLDAETGEYNKPFLNDELHWVAGYRRMQSLLFRPDDKRFQNPEIEHLLDEITTDPECMMINRNGGSGTRIVIDRLLDGKQPTGYSVQAKTHNAVATAIQQHRADWGIAIETVAEMYDLKSLPIQEEHYDFVIPNKRLNRPAVIAFRELLQQPDIQSELVQFGFRFA